MKVTFRQGIVRRQNSLSGPDWLQKTSLSGTSIDLNVGQEPILITFAHYGADYLFEETRSIVGAWGADSVGSVNGPLVASGQTQYLFWDVNLGTGELTRGWTLVPPIVSPNQPTNPVADTHWFDSTNSRMRVFRKPGSSPGAWQDKIRLFAAVYDSSATVIPYPLGSQVGITGGEWNHGNLILGTNNKPLKQSDGTFVTTESNLIIYQTSGQNVKFDMALVYAQAEEELPKYHLVSFTYNKRIKLASSNNMESFVSGIVISDHHQEEMAQVITNGVVRNEQWNWQPQDINKPIFVGSTGEIRLTPPLVGYVQQVGFIYEQDSIFMNICSPIRQR